MYKQALSRPRADGIAPGKERTTSSQSMSPHGKDLRVTFRALRYRNYRLFFAGQGISLVGTWMQALAMGWLVYRLTRSALMLGVVGFAGQIPALILAPVAGVAADRWNRHRIMLVTQTLATVQAVALGLLVVTGSVALWHILLLTIFLGITNSVDIPARQAFIVQMIGKREDLGNAIALNSLMFNGARLVGPSVAGVLIAAIGEGICFLLNGISYLAVIGALLAMKISPPRAERAKTDVFQGLRDGFRYAFGSGAIRSIVLLLGVISLVGMPFQVLMPVFAREVLHGGPHTLGFLAAASGAGALGGATYLASRKSVVGLARIIPIASSAFGTGLIAFSHSSVLPFSILFLLPTGFAMMVYTASSNTVLQTVVDDDKRGRVMAFYAMAFMGIVPFGNLLAGSLSDKIGAPNTVLVGGACCVLSSLVLARKLLALGETLPAAGEPQRIPSRPPPVAAGATEPRETTPV